MMYCFPAKGLMKSKEDSFVGYLLDLMRNSERYIPSNGTYIPIEVPDASELSLDILFCKNTYNIEFDFEETMIWLENYNKLQVVIPKLFFTTKEIILWNSKEEELNFGKFKIELSFIKNYDTYRKKFQLYDNISAVALNPKPAKSSPHIYHPNVSENNICLGDGDSAVHVAILQGRFSDAIELITNVLNTHSDSPYLRIDDWDKLTCGNCCEIMEENEEELKCAHCMEVGCKRCLPACPNCEDIFHNGCAKYCEACDKYICGCSFGSTYYCLDCEAKQELERQREEEEQDRIDNEAKKETSEEVEKEF